MNYGLDDVVENMECAMCEHCHAVKYDMESGCYDCPASSPESKNCVKHEAHKRIMQMLHDVEDAIYKVDHIEGEEDSEWTTD